MTALHWAAYADDVKLLELLLARGASVRASTRNGAITPLLLAARVGNAAAVRALLRGGAASASRTSDGATALMLAAASGSADTVAVLLDGGAEIDATDTARGQTALMFAAATNHPAIISLLVSRGANIAMASTVAAPTASSGSRRWQPKCPSAARTKNHRPRFPCSCRPTCVARPPWRMGGVALHCTRRAYRGRPRAYRRRGRRQSAECRRQVDSSGYGDCQWSF